VKSCKVCSTYFTPARPLQAVCSPKCAMKHVRTQKKAEIATTRQRKAALKTLSQLEGECRDIVQKMARIRDRDQGCISCDKPANWHGQWHGSHYRSHGACSALQFHLWNINKACWICNKIFSGRIDGYKVGIVDRYGPERLEWLDSQPTLKRYSRDYLLRFKKVMGKRLRRMEKRYEI
jgi:hypothetical protein